MTTQLQNGGSFHINHHFPMFFSMVFPSFFVNVEVLILRDTQKSQKNHGGFHRKMEIAQKKMLVGEFVMENPDLK
jgi:hypothetical protein